MLTKEQEMPIKNEIKSKSYKIKFKIIYIFFSLSLTWSLILFGNFEYIEYKNIYLLRRFISMQGKILSKRLNKVSSKQQRAITKSV